MVSLPPQDLLMEVGAPSHTIFKGRFRIERLLGCGGFGAVYRGVKVSSGEPVAIKMELITCSLSHLLHEAGIMKDVQKRPTPDGIPVIAPLKYVGRDGDYRMLIMKLMGPSLADIHAKQRRFSLKTTLMIGIQVVSRLKFIHSTGYIHRDLKPDNFVLGLGEHKNRIFMIDFGLSSRYLSSDGTHREEQSGKSFIGTARYASARTHQGVSQSRRDDIEQLVYVMIYLYRGRLPWSGLRIENKDQKQMKVGSMKAFTPLADICRDCPYLFVLLLNYARKIPFDETPSYDMITRLLERELQKRGELCDNVFDWDIPQEEKRHPSAGEAGDACAGVVLPAIVPQAVPKVFMEPQEAPGGAVVTAERVCRCAILR